MKERYDFSKGIRGIYAAKYNQERNFVSVGDERLELMSNGTLRKLIPEPHRGEDRPVWDALANAHALYERYLQIHPHAPSAYAFSSSQELSEDALVRTAAYPVGISIHDRTE